MEGDGAAVLPLKPKRDPRDRIPLVAPMRGSKTAAAPRTRASCPVRRKSLNVRTGAGLPMEEDDTVVIRLKHRSDPRDRIPLVPSKRDLECGSESA